MRVYQCVFLAVFCAVSYAANSESVYDATLKGKACSDRNDLTSQRRDCDYKIGDGFWLSIAAVGTPMATAHFMKSDFEGKYFASFLPSSYCAMISKGKRTGKYMDISDLAYVSLKNGKVYQNVAGCESGM